MRTRNGSTKKSAIARVPGLHPTLSAGDSCHLGNSPEAAPLEFDDSENAKTSLHDFPEGPSVPEALIADRGLLDCRLIDARLDDGVPVDCELQRKPWYAGKFKDLIRQFKNKTLETARNAGDRSVIGKRRNTEYPTARLPLELLRPEILKFIDDCNARVSQPCGPQGRIARRTPRGSRNEKA